MSSVSHMWLEAIVWTPLAKMIFYETQSLIETWTLRKLLVMIKGCDKIELKTGKENTYCAIHSDIKMFKNLRSIDCYLIAWKTENVLINWSYDLVSKKCSTQSAEHAS